MGFSLQDVGDAGMERWLSGAGTLDDFNNRIINLLRPAGITDYAHIHPRAPHCFLDPIGSYDPAVTDRFAREGFHHDDLVTQYLLDDPQPLFRSTIDRYVAQAPVELPVFRRHRAVQAFLASLGIHDVYNVPIVGPGPYYALLSISSEDCPVERFQAIVAAHQPQIHQLAALIDRIGMSKFKSHFKRDKPNPRLPIASRPLELVEVLANKDLTLNEAAEVLNMSISTANQHIAAAKKALGVSTTHGLVVAAQLEGLIVVER